MEIVNVNEAQFLSSLKQGRRVIDRTLNKMDRNTVEFPGKTHTDVFVSAF